MRIRTKVLVGVGAASALSVGLIGGLSAQSGESPDGVTPTEAQECGNGRHRPPGQRLNAVADVLGVAPGDIASALAQGGTLADVAAEAGVDTQVLVDAMVAELSARLDQAVSDGRIDQAEADARLAEAITRAETFIAEGPQGEGWPGRGERPHRQDHHGPRQLVGAVANILGVEPSEVVEAVQGGTSMAEFAASLGVSEQELSDAVLAEASARLAEAVSTGRITQEEADTKLAAMAERLSEALNFVPSNESTTALAGSI